MNYKGSSATYVVRLFYSIVQYGMGWMGYVMERANEAKYLTAIIMSRDDEVKCLAPFLECRVDRDK